MEPVLSEMEKAKKILETLSLSVMDSLDEMNALIDSAAHVYAEHISDRKMESVALMAGVLAHEINNFVHIIAVNTHRIREEAQDQKVGKRCEQILDVCQKTSDLMGDMMTLAESRPRQTEPLDLNDEVTKAASMLCETMPDTVAISASVGGDSLPILGNRTRIFQVLTNLMNNARDAIKGEGRICIAANRVRIGPQDCHLHANARPGEFAAIQVSDSGCGLPKHLLARIFDPFYSTKQGKKNAGLGLTLVYAIMQQHQGWIDVKSVEECGSHFTLYFPLCGNNTGSARTDASVSVEQQQGAKNADQ